MSVELIQQVSTWLRDPATGVAAQLAVMPKPGGEAATTAPTIYDDTERDDVAEEFVNPALVAGGPVLLVSGDGAITVGPEFGNEPTTAAVVLRYATRGAAAASVRSARRVMRAAQRALLTGQAPMAAPTVRHSVEIVRPVRLEEVAAYRNAEDGLVMVAVRVTYDVVDRWALGL